VPRARTVRLGAVVDVAIGTASWISIVESTAEPVVSGASVGATAGVPAPVAAVPAEAASPLSGVAVLAPPEAPPHPAMITIANAAAAARKIPRSI